MDPVGFFEFFENDLCHVFFSLSVFFALIEAAIQYNAKEAKKVEATTRAQPGNCWRELVCGRVLDLVAGNRTEVVLKPWAFYLIDPRYQHAAAKHDDRHGYP